MRYEFTALVDFLETLQEYDPPTEAWPTIVRRICGLKYVESAWIDHMCIIKIQLATSNAATADRRLRKVVEKATRLIRQYARKA